MTRLVLPICDHDQPKHFRSTFDFCESLSKSKKKIIIKIGCLIHLFQRNGWFKNRTIWLDESILGYISRTRFSSNLGFVQEQAICANNKNFHYRTNSVKFLIHFPTFWCKKGFPEKTWLCHAQLDKGFKYHPKIQKNLMIQFQENTQTENRTGGWTDPIS